MTGSASKRPGRQAVPALSPVNNIPDWASAQEMQLFITNPDNSFPPSRPIAILPLTVGAGLNASSVARAAFNYSGNLIYADASTYANISGSNVIPYLSCDNTNTSFVSQTQILESLITHKPKAILLYTLTGPACGINDDNLGFPALYSMVNPMDAAMTLNVSQSTTVLATINAPANTTTSSDTSNSITGSNSAVAMSILYSITGLITLLFLAIIATGAYRAHRHPERYGPRAGGAGRPRQSRARGIARAMLETIPIVKFGDSEPSKPDPDVELESGLAQQKAQQGPEPAITPAISSNETGEAATTAAPIAATTEQSDTDAVTAANPAAQSTTGSTKQDAIPLDKQVCSICTEDFNVGEDVRVLPCNHKFHPTCIDPWLVNVSGTCPLCRYDLRPKPVKTEETNTEEGTEESPEGETLPPPLEVDNADPASAPRGNRVSRLFDSRLLDVHRLRHASVEERIETLRRLRSQQNDTRASQAASTSPAAASPTNAVAETDTEERSRRAQLTARLRDRFRIRTRTQAPESQAGTSSTAGSASGPSS